ncbi:cingulin [Austrofundulus limnaeus]|uniref:Cingulin n=1 Tax=Austrofundulus limnaeus TaxID=52670 RepID=A0A2I4BBL2_AUSLI|nr:PREDICTED: cingulin [Austrofundulus limnaeus]
MFVETFEVSSPYDEEQEEGGFSGEKRMSTRPSGQKTPVDHGVQIRFINDLGDRGGGQPLSQPALKPQSKYGVAVRVQGIDGQPYVVLKNGQKGDSYGVQLRTDYATSYRSLPRRKDQADPGSQGEDGSVEQGGGLRRAQSHGSLLDRDGGGHEDFQLSRPPGDGKSGSYGNLDGGVGVRRDREDTWGGREGRVDSNMWGGSYQAGLNRSLGSVRDPDPPQQTNELRSNQRLTSVDRLRNRFDGATPGGQQRGPPPAPQQPRAPSPHVAPKPYTSPPSSTYSSSRPGQAPLQAPKHSANQWTPKEPLQVDLIDPQVQSSETSIEEEQLLKTVYNILRQGSSESDVVIRHKVKTIFQKIQSIMPNESPREDWVRDKKELQTKVAQLQTALQEERRRESVSSSDPVLKAELESCLDENLQLQETLDRKKRELNETQSELTQLRMDRGNAETRVRELEDQLAELQEELRRESDGRTDLLSCQAQLMDVHQLKQKLEETLRQRERELTALKGALKEEVATHDREIEVLREQYRTDMEKLRSSMEQVSQSHAGIEAERLRVNSTVRSLQQQLEDCRDESSHWMEQFHATRDELRSTKQEEPPSIPETQLLQIRLEKDECEDELKELKEKISSMKQQKPDTSHTETLNQELQRSGADLLKLRSELEKQRTEFDKKVMEVIAIKKSHQNQEAELKYEIDRLKDQLQKAKEDYVKAQEKTKQLPSPAAVSELEQKLCEAQREANQVKEKHSATEEELEVTRLRLSKAQLEANALQEAHTEQEATSARLKDKLSRLEAQLQSSATESSEAELALHSELRALRSELDEAKRKASRLSQEHGDVSLRLEAAEKDKEELKHTISQLEESRRLQDRALDKHSKEYDTLSAASREEIQALRAQLEEQKERTRKEVQEAQRHGSDAKSELERNGLNLRRLEEEMCRQKRELQLVCEERDNHQLDKELLTNRLRHLEGEVEAGKNSLSEKAREVRILEDKLKRLELELEEERDNHQLDKELLTNRLRHLEAEVEAGKNSLSEKAREVRILEDKLKRLELELEEERSNGEMLTERVSRSREQMDQLRSELLQERSSKQDLELDKNALERQLKEMRNRVADMETHSRSSTGVSQLETKIQELEERLRMEEREKNSVLASQRRLERKLKELNMTLDEERHAHTEQRDQLTLRVKALKRQVDESETELERIEALRRKAQRDMEEQVELREALQSRVSALETELKRKTQAAMRPVLDSSALSSDDDDDDDSLYDPSTITSILTESNLQTSSC